MYFTFIMLHDILEENIITFNNLSTSSSTVTNIANISLSLLLWSQNTWIFLWKFLLSEDTAKSAPLCYKMYYFALSFFFDLFHCTFLQINETLKHNNWLQWLICDKNCSCVFSFCLQEANQLYPSHETQQLSLCDCVCMCVFLCYPWLFLSLSSHPLPCRCSSTWTAGTSLPSTWQRSSCSSIKVWERLNSTETHLLSLKQLCRESSVFHSIQYWVMSWTNPDITFIFEHGPHDESCFSVCDKHSQHAFEQCHMERLVLHITH